MIPFNYNRSKRHSVTNNKQDKKVTIVQSNPLAPRPESPPSLDDIEFSLCGNAITLGDKNDLEFMFKAQKVPDSEIRKYLNDPNLIVRIGEQYYDAKSANYLLPDQFNKIIQEQLPNLVI